MVGKQPNKIDKWLVCRLNKTPSLIPPSNVTWFGLHFAWSYLRGSTVFQFSLPDICSPPIVLYFHTFPFVIVDDDLVCLFLCSHEVFLAFFIAPVITDETTKTLEGYIIQRIKDKVEQMDLFSCVLLLLNCVLMSGSLCFARKLSNTLCYWVYKKSKSFRAHGGNSFLYPNGKRTSSSCNS